MTDRTLTDNWTPEQRDNAMRYGVCMTCLQPREQILTRTDDETSLKTDCPDGHTEKAWAT